VEVTAPVVFVHLGIPRGFRDTGLADMGLTFCRYLYFFLLFLTTHRGAILSTAYEQRGRWTTQVLGGGEGKKGKMRKGGRSATS
jgi:hypothetical protein